MSSIGNIMTCKRHCLLCSIMVWNNQRHILLPGSLGEE